MKNRNRINRLVQRIVLLPAIFLLSCAGITWSQYIPYTQITDDDAPQGQPAMYGDNIVYEDKNSGGESDIMLYNIVTKVTTAITSDPDISSINPDIYENLVVWQDNRNGNWDLFFYDINNPQLGVQNLIIWEGDQVEPAIHENIIAFSDKKPGVTSWNIWYLNNSSGVLHSLTDDTDGDQRCPDVYKSRIVWQDQRMGNWDIYLYDTLTDEIKSLTEDPSDQIHPSIWQRRVVWEDYRNGVTNADIYMHIFNYGIGGPFEDFDWPVYVGDEHPHQDPYSQKYPQVYDDMVVFQDFRNGNWDIYLYKFFCEQWGNLYQVTSEPQDQERPAVYGDYVAWQDERDWDGSDPYMADIWMWKFPPGIELSVKVDDIPDPVKTGQNLTYNIYAVNNGFQDATNVVLTDIFPDGLSYVSTTVSGDGTCSRAGNTVTCDLDTISPGVIDTVIITVGTSEEGKYYNYAEITADEDELLETNNSQTSKTEVLWEIPTKLDKGHKPALALDDNNKAHICYITNYWEPGDLMYATNKTGIWKYDTIDSDVTEGQIGIDKMGNIHIVYVVQTESYEYELYHTSNDGSGWTAPLLIASNSDQMGKISIGFSPENIMYIAYLNSFWNSPIQIIYYKNNTWTGPIALATSSYNDLAMAVDTNGYLHLVGYIISASPAGPNYLTNAPDSIWKPLEALEPSWSGGQLETLNLEIALDNNNVPHVSYSGNYQNTWDEDFKYANRIGGTWSSEYVDNQTFSQHCAIALDNSAHAYLFYLHTETSKLKYANNTSGSWVKRVIDFDAEDICDIQVDNLGYKHFVYSEGDDLFYSTDAPPPPAPEIVVSPQLYDFGSFVTGDTTDSRKVTIENNGDGELIFDTIYIAWPLAANFSITNNTCPTTLAAHDSCSVDVAFNPETLGNKVALLFIRSNDPKEPTEGVSLKGTGLEPLMYIYGLQNFGEVVPGDSVVHDFKIKNKGNYQLQIQLAVIQEDDSEDFDLIGFPETPFQIVEEDSIEFQVKFKPLSPGEKSTYFRIYSSGSDVSMPLSGTCAEPTYDVSGSVLADGSHVNQGWIWVITLNPDNTHHAWYYKELEGSETFTIQGVPKDTITLQFDPDLDAFPGYLSTYLGDTPFSADATKFELKKDTAGIVINLVAAPEDTEGSSDISGNISGDSEQGNRAKKRTGLKTTVPLDSVWVYLTDNSSDEIIAWDVSDASGDFNFANIPTGTYEFKAEYMGYPMDSNNDLISITDENQSFKITATVANNKISAVVTSGLNIPHTLAEIPVVYPNPTDNKVYVKSKNLFKDPLSVIIIDAQGKVVDNADYAINSGIIRINAENLDSGMYIIRIKTKREIIHTKFVKMH